MIKKIVKLSNVQPQLMTSLKPLRFNFRIRNLEEMRLIVPQKWLCCIAIVYFVSSLFMASCESYLLSKGIRSNYSDLGPIHGVRIGLAVLFISTGITCLCLINRAQKRSTALATLFLAISSLISGKSFENRLMCTC